jgi:hypothetical protein
MVGAVAEFECPAHDLPLVEVRLFPEGDGLEGNRDSRDVRGEAAVQFIIFQIYKLRRGERCGSWSRCRGLGTEESTRRTEPKEPPPQNFTSRWLKANPSVFRTPSSCHEPTLTCYETPAKPFQSVLGRFCAPSPQRNNPARAKMIGFPGRGPSLSASQRLLPGF